ncbi:MAG: GNAT family N-acetyltransferase [Saprospiraceae bacterium]
MQCPFQILVVVKNQQILAGLILTKDGRGNFANPYLCKYLGVYYASFVGTPYNQETKRRKVTNLLLTEITQKPTFNYFFHPRFTTYFSFYLKNYESRLRYSYWINLQDQPLAQITANFHSKLRSEIKIAQAQSFSIVNDVSVNVFTQICQKTFLQKGHKFPFTIPFLNNYCQQLLDRKALQLNGIKDEKGRVMAVVGILITPQTNTLILSGFDKQLIQRGANEYLVYHCIQQAKKQADFFDFEGSMIPVIEAFYRKFGGEFRPYLNIYKNSTRQFLSEKLRFWYRRLRASLTFMN